MKRLPITAFVLLALSVSVDAGAGKKDARKPPAAPPPMLVAVSDIRTGRVEPMVEMVGTVYYARVARVAAEVDGIVEEVFFEEGNRIADNAPLVRQRADLLESRIAERRAAHEEALLELEEARKDYQRIETLYEEGTISALDRDQRYYREKRLEKKGVSIETSLNRLLLEHKKKTILAPFEGIVLEKKVEKGEWLSSGGTVAVIADDRTVDVVADVPQAMLERLPVGRKVSLKSGGRSFEGSFLTFVPRGDIATRTFAVKVRLENRQGLIEGMEARLLLPVADRIEGLMVSRDAVIQRFGRDVVFVVTDGKAQMVPVSITGYSKLDAGIKGNGLESGMSVVTKGNERIRDGQPVRLK